MKYLREKYAVYKVVRGGLPGKMMSDLRLERHKGGTLGKRALLSVGMRRKWWSGGRGRDRNRRFPRRDHGTRSVGSRRPKERFLIFFFCVSCILR